MRGTDGRRDPERIARVLADLRFDLAGLQEVTTGDGSDPGALLSRLTGVHAAFGPTTAFHGAAYGNAILSRHPIEATRRYDLSVPGREPRGCLRADVTLGSSRLHFFAAHLGLGVWERRRQAARLLSADVLRDTALAYPLVLVGDFNSFSRFAVLPRWVTRQLRDAALAARRDGPTWPSRFPLLRLDRCYVAPAFRVLDCEVVTTPLARRASDHLPVVVDLELLPGAPVPEKARPLAAEGVETEIR